MDAILKLSMVEVPNPTRWLRRLSRISAWLLLVTAVVMVISGWGITHTGIIYKATFGLIDRRLADSIHRAMNLPLAFFFLIHVLSNVRLILSQKNPNRILLIDSTLIIIGIMLMALVLYIEYSV